MKLSRRSFLRGAAVAAAVAPAIPLVLATVKPAVPNDLLLYNTETGLWSRLSGYQADRWYMVNPHAESWDFRYFGATTIANNGA